MDDGGSNLSDVQQARVSLTRAVYSRQSVVVLDEVVSGLDATTEEITFTSLLGPDGFLAFLGN